MSASLQVQRLGVAGLLLLQLIWHGWLLPSGPGAPWQSALLYSLPLLPGLLLALRARPSAAFWFGVASLFYFCHGVTEFWTLPQARVLALVETGLAVLVIFAGSWEGMNARFSKRSRPSPHV